MPDTPKKSKKLSSLRLDEISLVDRPANQEATLVLMKRAASDDSSSVESGCVTVPPEDGISSADHANKGADSMSEKDLEKAQADLAAATEKAEAAEKLAKRFEAIASLDGETRKHYDGLDGDDARDAFLAKSADERAAEVAAAAEADKVVFKAADGSEFRASDDPRLIKMAKQADEDRKALAKARAETEDANLTKRAEDLKHIPGSIEDRKVMLKAIDAVEDEETRKRNLESLKAQDAALGEAFKRVGNAGPATPAEGSPQAELEKMAKDYAAKNGVTEAIGMRKVAETPEGAALYQKTLN